MTRLLERPLALIAVSIAAGLLAGVAFVAMGAAMDEPAPSRSMTPPEDPMTEADESHRTKGWGA